MNEETKNDSDRTEELKDIVEEERLVYTMILRLDLIDVFFLDPYVPGYAVNVIYMLKSLVSCLTLIYFY